MSDMAQIDRNFAVKSELGKDDIRFYNVEEEPFRVHGVFKENGQYRRMPREVAVEVSRGVLLLHMRTSGGRVRFRTDSAYIAIKAEMNVISRTPVMNHVGANGFDLYVDGVFVEPFIPPMDLADGYESVIDLPGKKEREITIHFPIYAGVKELYIGLEEGACVKGATPYEGDAPIVCYGSSITQGGCASRAGMSYESIISRRLNIDYVNLGFSGNAKGEQTMADYIAGLPMSLFVYDYDYNAPTVELLQATHEKMFLTVREAHPDIPIVMMSRPKIYLTDEEVKRREIVHATWQNAVNRGDQNVYLLLGADLLADCGNEGAVDGVHPTDFGFASMARVLGDLLEKLV